MKCKSIKKVISPYIDDELTPGEREALSEHIGECQECWLLYEEIRTIRELCIDAKRYNAPFGFSEKVMANLEAGAETREWGFSLARMPLFLKLAEVAFALIVFFVGLASGYIMLSNGYGPEGLSRVEESYSLDVFDAAPPGSLGCVYIAVMGGAHHER